ncbi:unnamed protein product, partial [Closterium sp. Yama58-4]
AAAVQTAALVGGMLSAVVGGVLSAAAGGRLLPPLTASRGDVSWDGTAMAENASSMPCGACGRMEKGQLDMACAARTCAVWESMESAQRGDDERGMRLRGQWRRRRQRAGGKESVESNCAIRRQSDGTGRARTKGAAWRKRVLFSARPTHSVGAAVLDAGRSEFRCRRARHYSLAGARMASGEGDEVAGGRACYFHRDLKRGSYGGDVSCLQEYLRAEGFLYEEPSGYFGTATEEAVIKWQTSNALVPARGIVGYSSRVAYARKHGLPTTEQLRAMEKAAEGCEVRRCIEIDAHKRNGMELWERCLAEDASLADRMHLCSEACQMAVSEACDKAFPTSQNSDYKNRRRHGISVVSHVINSKWHSIRHWRRSKALAIKAVLVFRRQALLIRLKSFPIVTVLLLTTSSTPMEAIALVNQNDQNVSEAAEEAAQKAEKETEAAEAGAVDEWRWTLNWNHILPNLIVGSCPRSPDDVDRIADEAGATAILNLQSDLCFDALQIPFESIRARAVERGVLLARVPIRDFDHGDQAFMLPEAVRVVNVLLHRGHTVYVHCTAGINRASLVCVAYLYFVQGLRRDEAVTVVKSARPIAHPYLDCLADAKRRLLEGRQEEMTALATQIYEQRSNGGHTGSATSDWSAAQTTAIAASFRKFLEVDNGLLSMEDDLAAAAEARRQQQEEESDDERGEAVAAEIERLTGELRQQREEIQQLQAAARQWKLQKEQAEGMVQLLQQELAIKDAATAAAAAAAAATAAAATAAATAAVATAGGGAGSLKAAGSTNGVAVTVPYAKMTSSQVSAAFAAARTSKVTTIVWFRRDLRVEDNPALIAAAQQGAVVPLFVWSPEEEGQFFPGRVSRWWLRNSLSQLHAALTALGVPLFMRRAKSTLAVLLEVMAATGATQVFYNHLYDPASLVRDHRVKQELSRRGVVVRSFNADLLFEPWEIFDDHGKAFTTFRSFWRHCLHHPRPSRPDPPLPAPARLCGPLGFVRSVAVDLLGLEADDERPSNDLLARAWLPGCTNADRALVAFLHGPLLEYAANRSKADSATTSLLSPHLHFGEISARRIFHECQRLSVAWQKDGLPRAAESVAQFVRALGFREYSRYLSFNFPFTHERSLLANLKHFPWRVDEHMFKLWRQGRTGYPLVDAGMRELWATGWLHNRIRVVVASFCVKFLQLPWRWGMKYFWDTLLDADLEADVLGWQYISGSLPDGHELDRMDDPEEDGYRFDPEGEYVRRWVPELARVPTDWIHHPWDAPPVVLRMAGVELGANYPRPVLDVLTARQRLQEAVDTMWQREAALKAAAANGCDEGLGDTEEVLVAFSRAPDHRLPMRVHTALVRPELSCANGASVPAASHSTLAASARGGAEGLARSASCDSAAASGVGPWRGPADNGEGAAQGVRAGGEELPLAVQMEAAAAAVMAADRAGKAARGAAEGECGEVKRQVADGEAAELAAGTADGADGAGGAGGTAPGIVPWNDQMVPYFPSPATIQAAEAILAGDAAAARATEAEGVQPPFPKDVPAEGKGTRPPAPGAPDQPAAGKGNVAGGATSALPRWAAVLGGQGGGGAAHGTADGLSPSARVSSLVELQLFPSAPRPAPADGARAQRGKMAEGRQAEGSKKDGGATTGKEGGGVLGKRGFSNVWGDDTPFPSTMRCCRPPVLHAPPPELHAPPPVLHAPPPVLHAPPPVLHAPPPVLHAPPPVLHAPPPVLHAPPPVLHAPPPVLHAPPPVLHAPPPELHAPPPELHAPPPELHAPPPELHAPPPELHAPPPELHAPPPKLHAPPPELHAPPPELHAPPPELHAPPPVLHAPPPVLQAPPPVLHAPPPRAGTQWPAPCSAG